MTDVKPDPEPTSAPGPPEAQPLKTPKDKTCPFCHQAFTSSSLGRHLDVFIRPTNPKPPDGKHHVDEIRKMRCRITRRQVKPLKQDADSPATAETAGTADTTPPAAAQSPLPVLPRAKTSDAGADRRVSRQRHKAGLDRRQTASDVADTAKAAELALKELLKSVREASAKAADPGLFPFDPYALNFPGLCLHILPAPSTLFSPTPFPTSESWSIHPPGQPQFEALHRHIRERILSHQRKRHVNQRYPPSANNSQLPTPPLFDPDPQKLFSHLADAYRHWGAHTDKQRQEAWQVEILRSYARADRLRRDAELSLETARQDIEYLAAARSSSGLSELSPIRLNIGCDTAKELGRLEADFRDWDYDRLIGKWKGVVQESKHAGTGLPAQKPLPGTGVRSSSTASLPRRSSAGNSSALFVKIPPSPYSSAPPTTHGTEPNSDQLDAEGEDDDDAEADIDAEAASDDGSIGSHQFHGLPLQPTPPRTSQIPAHTLAQTNVRYRVQAHAQAQVQVHAQAQVQAWATAHQHMNRSRNQHNHPAHQPFSTLPQQQLSPHPHPQLSPHPHQQLSPHPSHMGSAPNSRRGSHAFIDTRGMNAGGLLPMDGIENHPNQFTRMGMSLPDGFVGSSDERV